jgi:hypothetical protein
VKKPTHLSLCQALTGSHGGSRFSSRRHYRQNRHQFDRKGPGRFSRPTSPNQIMSALNGIQDTLLSMQVQQEYLADVGMLYSSLTLIETWKNEYPTAVQNNDTDQINSYLQAFNMKGEGGAGYIVQNIFSVLTGRGQATPGRSGATPLVQVWHDQSYDNMYTPDANGQYTFTLKNYLDDLDQALGWALGKAEFALICQIIALQGQSTSLILQKAYHSAKLK